MNASGLIRGYLAKNVETEKFLTHVATTIQRQLQEWDEHYKVKVETCPGHPFLITIHVNTPIYKVVLSQEEVRMNQEKGPYALDRLIWRELQVQGMVILYSPGNYLAHVL